MEFKEIDKTIMDAKLFQQQHKPPAPRDKVADFLSYAKRVFSDLATYYVAEKNGEHHVGRRTVSWPNDLQVR